MQGLPLLLEEPHVAGVRDSDKTFSPDITEVKVIVSGVAKKVYSQGMKTRDMWEEVFRRFSKENSAMNATDFYARDRFGLFIDLKSSREMIFMEVMEIVEYEGGAQLANNRKASGSGNDKCYILILSDDQLNIDNRELGSATY